MYTVYKITNKINNKSYIGSSIRVEKRWAQHKNVAFNQNDTQYNYPLYKAFRKYGYENFKYEVLIDKINDIEALNQFEIYFIKLFNTQRPNGYNIEPGGKNSLKPKTE